MTGLKKGVIPDDLKRNWSRLKGLLDTAEDKEDIVQWIEGKILPKVEDYTEECQQHLVELGYAGNDKGSESPSDVHDMTPLERSSLLGDGNASGYGTHIQIDLVD